jgi:hypothetical protein
VAEGSHAPTQKKAIMHAITAKRIEVERKNGISSKKAA